jgi:hypothetical protein
MVAGLVAGRLEETAGLILVLQAQVAVAQDIRQG